MNLRRISIVLLIAFALSGLCTWLVGRSMKTHAAERIPENHCVTAAIALEPGHLLKAEDLKVANWPATATVAGTFSKPEDLIGRLILYPLQMDQPITDKFLASPGSGIGLAGAIPSGMRAIALRSDEVMGVAGFLFPGSRVDVLVTYRPDQSPETITLTVLQNVEVIAAGQKSQPDPEGKPVTATVVTLLLTPDDAQRAVLASTQGAVHFILRNGSDKDQPHEQPLGLSRLSGMPVEATNSHANPHPAATPHRAVEDSQIIVETIAGDKQSTQTFSRPR
jgi:pilus assembly protein CpaB